MAHSGIDIDQACIDAFNDLKQGQKHKYVIFKPTDDNKSIIVDKCGDKDADFDQFKEDIEEGLAKNQFRYGVFDTPYPENPIRTKIMMCSWAPGELSIKQRMLCASTKDNFKSKLNYNGKVVEITDICDCMLETFVEKADFKTI